MAVTAVRVYIHNETDHELTLVSSEVPSGEWATAPPDAIAAGTVGYLRAEADGFDPDTEGRAVYQIGRDPATTLYVHFNDPLVGDNDFHTNTDNSYYAFWTAAVGGRHAEVHFVVRPGGLRMTDFRPSTDGFRFPNRWANDTPYSLPPLRGSLLDNKYGTAKDGLCGGIVLAARDYFEAGWRIPATTTPPLGEQDPLFVSLVDRLFDTFSVDSVSLLLALMNPAYPDGDENVASFFGLAHGRAAVMAHEEWPIIRADVDAGHPSPICLVTVKSLWPGDLGTNHQVLVYGYEASGHDVVLHVYDPNSEKDDNVRMSFNDGDVSDRILVTHNVDVTDDDDGHRLPIYCFTRMDYSYRQPTVVTDPRLPSREIERRRLAVTTDELVTTSSVEVESGRGTYPVGPDCGDAEFTFRVYAETQSLTVTGVPRGYYDPVVVWRVGGVDIPAGSNGHVRVRVQRRDGGGDTDLELGVRHEGSRLFLSTLSGDLNFYLRIEGIVHEAEEGAGPGDRVDESMASFTGRRTFVEGLAEATADCFRDYLARHRSGEPDIEALIDGARAQLRRPPDPLWDPDPVMLEVSARLVQDDPTVVALTAEVSLLDAQQDAFHADLDRLAAAAVVAEVADAINRNAGVSIHLTRDLIEAQVAAAAAAATAQVKRLAVVNIAGQIRALDLGGFGGG